MQTTLDIDDDLIAPARALAAQRNISIDGLVSDMMRIAIGREMPVDDDNPLFERSSSGILALRRRHGGRPVTLEMVKALDELEDEKYFR